ncbi:hypothetical protein Pelo_1895 [Pelomyxa schiedti]|nr:hypothetical protein Pelo_1895 [Pelomyxa schiedti]
MESLKLGTLASDPFEKNNYSTHNIWLTVLSCQVNSCPPACLFFVEHIICSTLPPYLLRVLDWVRMFLGGLPLIFTRTITRRILNMTRLGTRMLSFLQPGEVCIRTPP